MKKLYALLVLLVPFALVAQKSVDLDRYKFSVQFRSLPSVKIDSTYRTYDVETETTRMMSPLLQDMQPEKIVRLEGWRKLPRNGHLSIKVKLGDLLPGDVAVKERVVTTKNGNGIITGTKTFYYQEVSYTFEADAIITDYRGMHVMDQPLVSRNYKRIYKSPEFTVRAIAEGYFIVNSLTITKELFRESVTNAMHRLSERITEDFGFDEVTANDNMWVIDSRKHPEYSAWRNALRQISDVLRGMNASTPATDARQQVQPAISYFEKIKKEYSSANRHDRKLRYACYYNLAVLYYYLDDPQSMLKEAGGLELNDFDAKDAKGFIQTATWLRNLFLQNNIYTRHFAINTDVFKGPGEGGDVTVK